jgi:hypothetical protein
MTQIQWGAGQCEGRKNLLGERNTDLRSCSAESRATADGCVVKRKIECIGNSNGLSTLRRAPRFDRLRTVQSIVAQRPLKVMRAVLRARRRRRASFRRSCFGLSIFDLPAACARARFPWPRGRGVMHLGRPALPKAGAAGRPSILSLNFHSVLCIAVQRGAKFGSALPQPFVCFADGRGRCRTSSLPAATGITIY